MVQPSTGPADPGGDAAVSYQWANPTTPSTDCLLLWAISWVNHPPGPSASSSQARQEVAQKAPCSRAGKAQLAATSQKRGRDGDPRASVWKIHLHPAGLSGENSLINLIPAITVACNTKTCLRTPTNPLMGLSQVLLHLLWPPAPLVTLPRHPSDGCGEFHSTPPCLCTWADTSSSYIVDHFISLNAKADYGLSDLTKLLSPPPFQC